MKYSSPGMIAMAMLCLAYSAEANFGSRRRLTHNTPENCIKKCNNLCGEGNSNENFCGKKSDCRIGCLFGEQVVGGCGDEVGSLFTNGLGCQAEPKNPTDFGILVDCDEQCARDNSDFESCHEGCLFFHQILSGSPDKRGTENQAQVEEFAFHSCRGICRWSDDASICRDGCRNYRNNKNFNTCITNSNGNQFFQQGCKAMDDLFAGKFVTLDKTNIGSEPNPNKPEDDPNPDLDEEDPPSSASSVSATMALLFGSLSILNSILN